MKARTALCGLLGAAVLGGATFVATPASAEKVLIPLMSYRTGPYAPNGTPVANGMRDYMAYLNKKGGIDGVMVNYKECETGYSTDKGVECYERLKGEGAVVAIPLSTGITYKLVPKAPEDKIPVHSMGYGMSAAADGSYFPWIFNFPTTYWSQATAIIKYIGSKEGGLNKLKGKKIGFIFLESSYGREPISIFKALGKKYGYRFYEYSVPGKSMQDQRSQWRKIANQKPNWMIMWGWGAMNSTAVQRAAEFGYPRDHFIGGWWSGAEPDVRPAGKGAVGYLAASFNPPGSNFPLLQNILKDIYGGDQKKAVENNWGEVLYNRGVFQGVILAEAARYAVAKHGKKVTGTGMREGLEHLNLTAQRLTELGLKNFTKPIKVTCADHEGNGPVLIQQWDGKKWNIVSDWITPMRDVVRPALEKAAMQEAAKFKYKKRDCK
jgi:branched-chain amino acid transport system substrate-binding protein